MGNGPITIDALPPEVSVVVPLHDEEANLPELHRRLTAALAGTVASYELVLVDDGSRDRTGAMLDELARTDPRVRAVHLARNFGHQPAITAGLERARGGAVVVMDGDLQDPPEVLPALIAAWRAGAEVAYAVRAKRREGPFKRLGYAAFYRLWRAVAEFDVPLDSGDFGLMDRQVVDAINSLPERARFVRGLRAWVGFRQVAVPYDRAARAGGESKYRLPQLVRLASDGLISFSGRPLRLATHLGLFAASVALALTVWVVWDAASRRSAPPGWASTMVVVLFMGAVQLVSLGIIGEYLRLIFLECKGRPSYVARENVPLQATTKDEPPERPEAPGDGTPKTDRVGDRVERTDRLGGRRPL